MTSDKDVTKRFRMVTWDSVYLKFWVVGSQELKDRAILSYITSIR